VGFKQHNPLTQYYRTDPAVVVVRQGETRDDAWQRYLDSHPEKTGARVKIFHYPGPGDRHRAETV
jgi:hypothetical protein